MHSGEMRLHRTFSQEYLQMGHKNDYVYVLSYGKLLFAAFSSHVHRRQKRNLKTVQ